MPSLFSPDPVVRDPEQAPRGGRAVANGCPGSAQSRPTVLLPGRQLSAGSRAEAMRLRAAEARLERGSRAEWVWEGGQDDGGEEVALPRVQVSWGGEGSWRGAQGLSVWRAAGLGLGPYTPAMLVILLPPCPHEGCAGLGDAAVGREPGWGQALSLASPPRRTVPGSVTAVRLCAAVWCTMGFCPAQDLRAV